MLFVYGVFWLILGWGLYDAEIYFKEAIIFALVWVLVTGAAFSIQGALIPSMIGSLLIDVVLILRVFGSDITIR